MKKILLFKTQLISLALMLAFGISTVLAQEEDITKKTSIAVAANKYGNGRVVYNGIHYFTDYMAYNTGYIWQSTDAQQLLLNCLNYSSGKTGGKVAWFMPRPVIQLNFRKAVAYLGLKGWTVTIISTMPSDLSDYDAIIINGDGNNEAIEQKALGLNDVPFLNKIKDFVSGGKGLVFTGYTLFFKPYLPNFSTFLMDIGPFESGESGTIRTPYDLYIQSGTSPLMQNLTDIKIPGGAIGWANSELPYNAVMKPGAEVVATYYPYGNSVPPKSSDASLSSLALSTGSLSPAFAAGVNNYTASVDHSVSSVNISATAGEANATVKVGSDELTSDNSSGNIILNEGDNIITVTVTAQDGTTTATYTITVTREAAPAGGTETNPEQGTEQPAETGTSASAPATITAAAGSVTSNSAILNGTINANGATASVSFTYSEDLNLLENGGGITVAANPGSAEGKSDTGVSAELTDLTPGHTYFYRLNGSNSIGVNAGSILSFTTTALSSDTYLSALAVSAGKLSPEFSSENINYSLILPNSISTITLTPVKKERSGVIKVNERAVADGDASDAISLSAGNNTITILSTAEDGTSTRSYTINVVRLEAQTITFEQPTEKVYGDASFTLAETASSGLAILYTSDNTSVATVAGNVVTIKGAGLVKITASQAGNSVYEEAKAVERTFLVGKKAITVTASAKSKVYGDPDPSLTYSLTEGALVGDDLFSGSLEREAGENVGSYSIMQGSLALNPNYDLKFIEDKLTVNKKALTVTADNKSKTYGDVNPSLSVTYSGLVNGETALNPAPVVSTAATALSGAGMYDITASGTAANYELSFQKGTLTVNKKFLTVTAENKSKTYGDVNPALSLTYSGLVNGETALSPAPLVSTAATVLSGVGTYDITASGEAANYNVNYVKGTLTVNKKALTITAADKEKFQGLALPVFTANYLGFVNGETSSVLSTQPVFVTIADAMSPQGTYPITVSGATAANYAISFVPGTLTVKPGFPTSITLAAAPVFENAAAGALAGTLSSTSDDPSATFTYTLVNGTGDADNASFKIVGNQIQTNAVLNFENKSRYSVLVRSTTQHGLSLDKPLTITIGDVNEQPTLDNIANSTICYTTTGQSVALSGITSGPDADQGTVLSVSTSNNGLFKSLEVDQAINGSSAVRYKLNEGVSGSAVINVLVTDNGGTENGGLNTIMKSFTLNVNALPVIAITSDKGNSLSKGEIALLKAELTSAGPAATYSWSNANGILSGQNSSTLEVRPTETTTYTVTVTNANQCSSTETITIEVRADFQVVDGTNIVTPNGDGVNDNFVIRNIDMYPNNVVKIFDRAGRLLYSKTNYGNEWTGTVNGSPLAEDTYYYIVDFGAGKQKIKGFITIVRD